MTISYFGNTTSGATGSIREIGELMNVSTCFTNDNYLDTGSDVDPVIYPELAARIVPGYSGVKWTKSNIPMGSMALGSYANTQAGFTNLFPTIANVATVGTFVNAFSVGGEYLIFFSKGQVFKLAPGSFGRHLMQIVKTIPVAIGAVAHVSYANNKIYVSHVGSTTVDVFDDATLSNTTTITVGTLLSSRIVYANSTYMAFNGTALLFTSSDGITFTQQTIPTTAGIAGIDYGAGLWVVATSAITASNFCTSPDGTTWTIRNGPTTGVSSCCWVPTKSLFILGPSAATAIYRSADGLTWTSTGTSAFATPLSRIDYVNVAGGDVILSTPGQAVVTTACMNSVDGITWVNKASVLAGAATYPMYYNACVRGSSDEAIGLFAIGRCQDDSGQYSYTTSASKNLSGSFPATYQLIAPTETPSIRAPMYIADGLTGVIFENIANAFSIYGMQSSMWPGRRTGIGYMYTNDGGATWTPAISDVTIASGKALRLVYVGVTKTRIVTAWYDAATTSTLISSSTDGVNWVTGASAMVLAVTASVLSSIESDAIMLSYNSSGHQVTTNYGNSFQTVGDGNPSTFYSGGGDLVTRLTNATGHSIGVSTDGGVTFQSSNIPTLMSTLNNIASIRTTAKGIIVQLSAAAGNYSTYFHSTDNGATWNQRTFPYSMAPMLQFMNGMWIGVLTAAQNKKYVTSQDGISWDSITETNSDVLPTMSTLSALVDGSGYMIGTTYYLRSSVSDTKRVPYVPGSTGSKWVVRAK